MAGVSHHITQRLLALIRDPQPPHLLNRFDRHWSFLLAECIVYHCRRLDASRCSIQRLQAN